VFFAFDKEKVLAHEDRLAVLVVAFELFDHDAV
jgi:hypothetical protein